MREASAKKPLILGVDWKNGDTHLVVCAGKASTDDKVWIFDPGAGLIEHPVTLDYKQGNETGTFDLKGVQVLGPF
jgi:hypothetical protein